MQALEAGLRGFDKTVPFCEPDDRCGSGNLDAEFAGNGSH